MADAQAAVGAPSPARRGRLFVVSGPSGVGKDTVLARLHEMLPDVVRCVTATSRPPRPGEVEGRDYFFVSVARFREMVESDQFLEYATVHEKLYGTPRAWVENERDAGHDIILKIDVQGGLTVRERVPDAVLVFLTPPSVAELERRLRARLTDTEDQINIRLLDARSELQQMRRYDFSVVNDAVENAAGLLRAIILAERARIQAQNVAAHYPHDFRS